MLTKEKLKLWRAICAERSYLHKDQAIELLDAVETLTEAVERRRDAQWADEALAKVYGEKTT
jgi:hypothetical protein